MDEELEFYGERNKGKIEGFSKNSLISTNSNEIIAVATYYDAVKKIINSNKCRAL